MRFWSQIYFRWAVLRMEALLSSTFPLRAVRSGSSEAWCMMPMGLCVSTAMIARKSYVSISNPPRALSKASFYAYIRRSLIAL